MIRAGVVTALTIEGATLTIKALPLTIAGGTCGALVVVATRAALAVVLARGALRARGIGVFGAWAAGALCARV